MPTSLYVIEQMGHTSVQMLERHYAKWMRSANRGKERGQTRLQALHRTQSGPRRYGRTSAKYRWSSYRVNGQGEGSRLVTSHPIYKAFGQTAAARQAAYRELFRYEPDPDLIDEIRQATNGNYVLGTERFEAQVARMLGPRVSRGTLGRPKKKDAD